MKKAWILVRIAVAFMAVLATPRAAKAACCDDFWSCAGAFFTAGASCAVEAAVEEIDGFVKRVERTRDDGKARMDETTRSLDSEAQNACGAENRASSDANARVVVSKLAGKAALDKGKGASTAIGDTLARGQAELDRLAAESNTAKDESAAKLAAADAARQERIRGLRTAFQVTFVAPLTGLVAPLIAAMDPISAVATIALLAESITRIERETTEVMARGIGEFETAMRGFLDELKARSAAQKKRSESASALALAMKTLADSPTEQNRQKVEALLGPAAKPKFIAVKLPANAILFNASNLTTKTTLPTIKQGLTKDAQFAKTVKGSVKLTYDKTTAEQKTQNGLEERLKGKAGKALEDEKAKLIAEVRERFKKDKNTRAALEKAINDEVKKRQAPVMIAPPKIINPKAPVIKK